MPVITIAGQIESARIWAAERADAYRCLDEEVEEDEEEYWTCASCMRLSCQACNNPVYYDRPANPDSPRYDN